MANSRTAIQILIAIGIFVVYMNLSTTPTKPQTPASTPLFTSEQQNVKTETPNTPKAAIPGFDKLNIPSASIFNSLKIFYIQTSAGTTFRLLSHESKPPRADGDAAQQFVIDNIELAKKCEEDPETIVVDVGGFLGDFGMSAASLGCKVYIFEPIPFNYWMIKGSVDLNGYGDRVKVYNYAVSPKNSIIAFKAEEGRTAEIPFEEYEADPDNPEIFLIHTISLDDVLPTETIYLLKVDVEGFEPTVILNSSVRLLKENRVQHLISEYTTWLVGGGRGPWVDFLSQVRAFGTSKTKSYALDRSHGAIYAFNSTLDQQFHDHHNVRHWQTDVYFDFRGEFSISSSPWTPGINA